MADTTSKKKSSKSHAKSAPKKSTPKKRDVKSAPPKKLSTKLVAGEPGVKNTSPTAGEVPPEKPKRKRFDAEDAKRALEANAQARRLMQVGTNRDSFRTGGGQKVPKLPEQYEIFFKTLAETANASKACIAANLSRDHVYDLKRADKAFAKRWDDAMELGWLVMEEEAQRRAFEGVDKPVYNNGFLVDAVKEYSDTLAMFLLRGRNRKVFGDKKEVTVNPGAAPYATLTDDELDDLIAEQIDIKVEK